LEKIDNLKKEKENDQVRFMNTIRDQERAIEQYRMETQNIKKSHEELEDMLIRLPENLSCPDENSTGYLPDAPHAGHYLPSWLPFAGSFYLHSLRTKAEKNHNITLGIVKKLKKFKKKP